MTRFPGNPIRRGMAEHVNVLTAASFVSIAFYYSHFLPVFWFHTTRWRIRIDTFLISTVQTRGRPTTQQLCHMRNHLIGLPPQTWVLNSTTSSHLKTPFVNPSSPPKTLFVPRFPFTPIIRCYLFPPGCLLRSRSPHLPIRDLHLPTTTLPRTLP